MKGFNWIVTFERYGDVLINTMANHPHDASTAAIHLLPDVAEAETIINVSKVKIEK